MIISTNWLADYVQFPGTTADLVERLRHGWPLAEPADMAAWYSPTGAAGYTDFPAYATG